MVASDRLDLSDPPFARNGAGITFVGGNGSGRCRLTGVPPGELGTVLVGGVPLVPAARASPNWSPDGATLTFQLSHAEAFHHATSTPGPVAATRSTSRVPRRPGRPSRCPTAPLELGPTFLADGRLIFVQDGNVYLMAAQRGAGRTLLADLPYAVRSVDARGAHTRPK